MASTPTRLASCPSRWLSLVCKIPIPLFSLSETNTIGYYAKWFQLLTYPPYAFGADTAFAAVTGTTTVFYTPAVVNTPGRIAKTSN